MAMYGGDAMRWLADTPAGLVKACWTMLPRIRARQALREVHVAAIGAGNMAAHDRKRILGEWERTANGGVVIAAHARVPSSAELAGMGVGVIVEPAPVNG